jgi:hypothetical protein
LLTLVVVPAVYSILEGFLETIKTRLAAKALAKQAAK